MALILKMIPPSVYKALGLGLAVIAVVFGLIHYGRVNERQAHEVEELQEYSKTKERIDEVETSPDRGAAIKRLRSSGLIRESDM